MKCKACGFEQFKCSSCGEKFQAEDDPGSNPGEQQKGCGNDVWKGKYLYECGYKGVLCPSCSKQKWSCKECGSEKKSTCKDICQNCCARKWARDNPEKINKATREYRERNPEKKAVWDKASRHIKIEGLCQVCNKENAIDRHHHDYSKPLEVILICRKCHKDIHKEEKLI